MSSILSNVLDQEICVRLTQTLLHFLWEGLAIGLCSLALAWLCRSARARVRYGVHAVGLVLMALSAPVTFALLASADLRPVPGVASSDFQSSPSTQATEPAPELLTPIAAMDGVSPTVSALQEAPEKIDYSVPPTNESPFEFALRAGSPYAACTYLIGVLVMLVRLGCALWGGHRLRRCAEPIRDRQLLLQIRQQAARIGLKFVPVVAYCERIAIPVVSGIFRPVVLLPSWLAAELESVQLLSILAHEMAHIRRFDLLVNLLQRLLETALFFHPAVWIVGRQLSFERENCCDDAVVQAGYKSVLYASTLVRMAELCLSNRRPIGVAQFATLAASGANGSELKRRILRLLGGEQRLRVTRADSLTLVLMAGMVAGLILGVWRHAFAAPDISIAQGTSLVPDPKATQNNASEVEFGGTVVDVAGKPVAGAEIWFAMPANERRDTAERGTVRELARSNGDGKFSFRLAPVTRARLDPNNWTFVPRVTAKAPGYGLDWLPLAAFEKKPVASDYRKNFQREIDDARGQGRFASQTLELPPQAGPVQGRLVDLEGRPLADVVISVENIEHPDVRLLNQAFEKSSRELFHDALNLRRAPMAGITRNEWQVLMPPVKTNSQGEFSLPGLGRDQLATVTLSREHVAAERLFILGREMETKRLPHLSAYPDGAKDVFLGTRFTQIVGPAVPVSGVVTEFKSERPIAGATVMVERLFSEQNMMNSANQIRLNTRYICTVTDEQGRFHLIGIPPGQGHVLNVIPPRSEPWLIASQKLSLDPDQKNATVNIQVFRGIWLEGRVTDATTGDPVSGNVDYLALSKNPNIPQRFGLHDDWQMDRFPIDEAGHYRVAGLPGPGVLLVRSLGKTVYPLSIGAEKVDGYNPKNQSLPTSPVGLPLANWHRVQQIDPAIGAKSFTFDLNLSAGLSLAGQVVELGGMPASNVEALGLVDKNQFFARLKDNKFDVHHYNPAVPRNLFFKASGSSLVGYLHLEGTPPKQLTVRLQPAVTVLGRLTETETGEDAVGYNLYAQSTKLGEFRIDDTTTDEHGRFEIKGFLAGNVYKMDASNPQHFVNQKNGFTIDLTNSKPGDVIDLGYVTGKKAKSGSVSK